VLLHSALKYLSVCKWKNFESNKTLITILRSKIKVLLGLAIKYDYFRINADNLKNKIKIVATTGNTPHQATKKTWIYCK